MFFPWLFGGALLGLLLQLFSRLWDKLDNQTKKLIIESVVKAFEEVLRAFYKWWKQKGANHE